MLRLFTAHKQKTEPFRREYGNIHFDCVPCGHEPDMGTRECVRCVTEGIMSKGEPERIILHGNSDHEYRSGSLRILIMIAEAGGMIRNFRNGAEGKRCRSCKANPSVIMGEVWSSFPEPDMDSVRSLINVHEPSGKDCEDCLVNTYHSLDRTDHALRRISEEAAGYAFGLTEV